MAPSLTDSWSWLFENDTIRCGVATLVFLGILLTIRMLLIRMVLNRDALPIETKRRWIVAIRNTLALIFLLGLLLVWAPQLRSLALTLIAIALAIVFAIKELLLCLSAAYLRMVGKFFSPGDRIEVNGVRGIVLDHGWLTTTLLEIGPGHTSHQYTGRVMFLPNSLLFNGPLTNETYTQKYILHTITVPLAIGENWQVAERLLLEAARIECQPFLDDAKRHMKRLEGKHWLDAPSVEPQVTIQLSDPHTIKLLLRIPCPAHGPANLEQAILRRFLQEFTPRQTPISSLPESVQEPAVGSIF
ncbi:MAG: mechanosensitive ion channel family protein [Nitrospirae bacterium]|nr:MAG: mechanosensitive ion channel family protein [Nitrospirota bacterium]